MGNNYLKLLSLIKLARLVTTAICCASIVSTVAPDLAPSVLAAVGIGSGDTVGTVDWSPLFWCGMAAEAILILIAVAYRAGFSVDARRDDTGRRHLAVRRDHHG